MMRRPSLTIENKILIPFVSISIVTVLCFCYIVYDAEYKLRIETETANATALIDYINADIDAGEYWRDPNALLEKYEQSYRGDSLFHAVRSVNTRSCSARAAATALAGRSNARSIRQR